MEWIECALSTGSILCIDVEYLEARSPSLALSLVATGREELLKRQVACMHKRKRYRVNRKVTAPYTSAFSPYSSAEPPSRHLNVLLAERRILLFVTPLPHIFISPVVPPSQSRAPRPPRGRRRRSATAGDHARTRRLSTGTSAPRSGRIGRAQRVASRVGPLVPLPSVRRGLHARQRWRCRCPRAGRCASGGAVRVGGRDVLDRDLLSA